MHLFRIFHLYCFGRDINKTTFRRQKSRANERLIISVCLFLKFGLIFLIFTRILQSCFCKYTLYQM